MRFLRPATVLLALLSLVAGGLPSSAGAALIGSCAPSFNGAGTLAPGTVVAPYLKVVKSSYALGTCDSTIAVTTRSPDGTLWGVDMGGAKNGLWRSTDGMQSWQLAWQPANWQTIEHVLPLASGAMIAVVVDSAGIRHIVRAPDSSGSSFSATTSLDFPAAARIHSSQSWVEANGSIFVAEYGDPAVPIMLWKSTDDGRTFAVAYSRTDARHYHAVQADPYQANRVWLTVGDTGTQPRIGYSDNGGGSFTWITALTYPQSRALTLMFTADAVYWGTDTPDVPAPLMRWDRATGAITTVLSNLNGPFYNSLSWNGVYLQFSTAERTSDGYIGDNYIHVLSSLEGRSWTLTRTPFVRTAGATDQNAGMWHFTEPDAQGRFWGSFFNLDGTQFKTANILFQIDPNATYNGARAAFTATPTTGTAATFDGSASSSPAGGLAWTWQYGDGSTGSGSTSSHVYASAGSYLVRLQVKDARGDVNETTGFVTVRSATTAPPSAATSAATNVTSSSATLNGSANPNGTATTVSFQYGTSTAYGSTTAALGIGSGTSSTATQAALSGLVPSTTYHFRLVATSAAGTSYGADTSFTTLPSAPVAPGATTSAATGITSSGATGNASVNPNGLATSVTFEFGTSTAYGAQTAVQTIGSATSASAVQAALTGLAPSTTYHYRVVATSSAGTTYGQDVAFTTAAPVAAPVVTVKAPVKFPGGKAQLTGTINPGGDATTYYFRYGPTTAYGNQTSAATLAAGTTAVSVNAVSGKLTSGATYHLQLVATNQAGTTFSADVAFVAP